MVEKRKRAEYTDARSKFQITLGFHKKRFVKFVGNVSCPHVCGTKIKRDTGLIAKFLALRFLNFAGLGLIEQEHRPGCRQ